MPKTSTSTQNFVPIRDIKDGIVIMKNGQMNMVLLASSVNFALKSSEEQASILHQFQSFLNTIDFSLQVYVQSRRLDIGPYLEKLAAREPEQDNDLMRIQLREYMSFVGTFATEVDIMSKNFFVVIPYNPININLKSNFSNLLGGNDSGGVVVDEKFAEHRLQLEQRVSVVEQGLNRVGVRTAKLQNDELVELFYHIFNPSEVGTTAPGNA